MSENQNGTGAESPDVRINQQGERIQELLKRVEATTYPGVKELMHECMEAVLAFYGEGLSRIMEVITESGQEGQKVYQNVVRDEVIKGLLLIHDMHPQDLEARLREALDRVRPYLRSHGGNVELISLEKEVARLRLQGTCQSCASSAVTLELAIKQAIRQACPDLAHFEVEGVTQVPLPTVPPPDRLTKSDWTVVDRAGELLEGEWQPLRVANVRLIICRVNGMLYAYRNRCPACNMPFDSGTLDCGILSCSQGHRYDVRRAGQSQGTLHAHLDPVPLLVENGAVKVVVAKEAVDAMF